MGGILQEAAMAGPKKVSFREGVWTKVPGSTGPASSCKKGKVNHTCRSEKRLGAQPSNVSAQPFHDGTRAAGTSKGTWVKAEKAWVSEARPNHRGAPLGQRASRIEAAGDGEELPGSRLGRTGSRSKRGHSRRHPSAPLPSDSDVHQTLPEQDEVYADSASDLSDSERFPIRSSARTPPQLNLRPEVIGPCDLQQPLPGQRGPRYSYPDFLPPPFDTWSLRQLAVFLNTEGRAAPRPRPVGHLEKYLERLLQLEWIQIQTVQEESGKPAAPVSASWPRPRPHTAPPTRLSSPKSLRQCQRAFPLAFVSSLAEPSSGLLSGRVCPHCRIRYPFCSGTCRFYTQQHYSRPSPHLERRTGAATAPRRSSSESRACAMGHIHDPVGPATTSGHLRRMQAVGNMRKATGAVTLTSSSQIGPLCAGTNGSKDFTRGAAASSVNMEEVRAGSVRGGGKAFRKDSEKDPVRTADDQTFSKGLPCATFHRKQRNVTFVPSV